MSLVDEMKNALQPFYQNMMQSQGYAPDILAKIKGGISNTMAGARRGFTNNLGRTVASQGMGNTGLLTRNLNQYDTEAARTAADANQNVDIQSADYGNQQRMAGAQGMAQMYPSLKNMQVQQNQMDNSGFWGGFKKSLASGLGSAITGGMGRAGENAADKYIH